MKRINALILALTLNPVFADNIPSDCGVHTWHDVVSAQGQWKVTLKMISQNGKFYDQNCADASETVISPGNSLNYGFSFGKGADFNLAYTLTAVSEEKGFQNKACVFVITANGPAQPDIQALSYYGADCRWNVVKGVGENFLVG